MLEGGDGESVGQYLLVPQVERDTVSLEDQPR